MTFDSIDVSSFGPFAEHQAIHFNDELNLIQGPSGSGKTTIFRELMRFYRESFDRDDIPLEIAVKLTFIGEGYARGQEIVAASQMLPGRPCLRIFPQLISHYVNLLIAKKVLSGHSKFGRPSSSQFPFVVSTDKSGELRIANSAGGQVDGLFLAAGESLLLSLACNLALRDILDIREPLVVDEVFEMLDDLLLPSCYDRLLRTRSQKILLLSKRICEEIKATPHCVLAQDQHERTVVVAMRT